MKKSLIFPVALLALLASCQKPATSEAPAQEPVLRTFTCTIAPPASDDPASKVAISDEGKSTWEAGDEILIHGKYFGPSYFKTVTLTADDISADGKKATFTVDLTDVTPNNAQSYQREYYAAYPANCVGGGSNYNNGDNLYYYNCFTSTNAPLMAAYQEGDSFVFYNLTGVISFKVSGDFDSYSFKGNSSETVGYGFYRVKIVPSEQNYKHKLEDPLTVLSGAVTPDGATTHYICLPNGTDFTGGFTISFIKDGAVVKTVSTSKGVNVTHGKILPLGDITDYLKDYVAPATHDNEIGVDMASAIDLGASETANSYIVSAAGDYKFKAVKGNGSVALDGIEAVDILWETVNTATAPEENTIIAAADYDLQEGEDPYIVFKTPATLKPGNALIAAKNAAGQVLWSWHIWIPETEIVCSTYGGLFGEKVIMDRNLGALIPTSDTDTDADPLSYGMYYQWGRKDPFVAPGTAVAGSISYGGERTNVEGSVLIPNIYITTGSDSVKDWNTESTTDLWGKTKTMYDPCPPGYVVPTRDKSTVWWADSPLALNFVYNTTYKWFKAGVAYDEDNPETTGFLVFPVCGYIDQGSLAKMGTRVYIWSSYSSATDLAYQIRGEGGSVYREEQRKSRAGNIRCVAE